MTTEDLNAPDEQKRVPTLAPVSAHVAGRRRRPVHAGHATNCSDADLGKMMQILKDANYHGYVVLEYEAAGDPKVEVPKALKQLRSLIG